MSTTYQAPVCGAEGCGLGDGARVIDAGMDLVRCPVCDVLRIPTENLIHSYVRPDPVGKLPLSMQLLMSIRMLWLEAQLPQIRNKHVRIADIGCGDGQFLEFLKGRGYDRVFGIEPDETRARNAQLRNVPVFASGTDARAAGFATDNIDIVFVWQVLEHIERPANFLNEYAQWLAPSGVMVIAVPNHASVQTTLFGYYSAYPDYGRHIWYHKPNYLDWFARSVPGMAATLMRDRNYEYEIFAWVDSLASAATRQQNLVHKAVKKGEGSLLRRVLATIMGVALLPVAIVLAPISLLSGRGSTLTFVLRKR